MSHGRIRGFRPPVLPTGTKTQQTAKEPGRVGVRPGGAVLGPGQHIVLPSRTGLAHLRDHFDARNRPDYEARLKGEAPRPGESQANAGGQQPAASAFDPAQQAAAALLQRMPLPEEDSDSGADQPSEQAGAESLPSFEAREVELQGALFTLAEGSIDAEQHPLATLEAFLDGDVPFVSVAVDLSVVPYGLPLRIPALDAAWGRPLAFRAVHQTDRTQATRLGYLEICVSVADEAMVRALDRRLVVSFG